MKPSAHTPGSMTPLSARRQTPNFWSKVAPCLQAAGSISSVNTIGSTASRILDPVQVYCRVRPLEEEEGCIKVWDKKSFTIMPPEVRLGFGPSKEMTYSFEQLFDGDTQQLVFDEIALPLVKDFLQGKNSLLFAYGITGSGKTYTMSGTPSEPGIMPRCLDVIFNSISEVKAIKYLFKSDHLNGFETQGKAEAMLDRQKEIAAANIPKTPGRILRNARPNQIDLESNFVSQRAYDSTIVPVMKKDSVYSVFITYIEIYNNFVYDLLDDPLENATKGKMRMLREDVNHNVYVNGVTEIEVQSADDAFEVFNRGQKQRRIAHTTLNTESSRSHSIFNIRLVQAPIDEEGEVAEDKNTICISQLSLVDLAGSERYGRTGATGERLKEAGNINNSLMTLRKCMEALRENQRTNSNRIIPFRDTKLTHFLKNYFEGEGRVRLMLCINPRADDYDENLHVLTFAEVTKEVTIPRPPPTVTKVESTPFAKRKAEKAFESQKEKEKIEKFQKQFKKRFAEAAESEHNIIEPTKAPAPVLRVAVLNEPSLGFGMGPALPVCKMTRCDEAHVLANLRTALELRISNRLQLHSLITQKRNAFRARLITLERTLEQMNVERNCIRSKFETVSGERESLEVVLRTVQFEKNEMDLRFEAQEKEIRRLKDKLENCQMETRQREVAHMKEQEKLKSDLELEKELDEMRRDRVLQKEEAKLKAEFKEKEKTIQAVRQLVSQIDKSDVNSRRSRSRRSKRRDSLSTSSESDILSAVEKSKTIANSFKPSSAVKLPADSSPSRYRRVNTQMQISSASKFRSRSTDNDKWLEHASGVGVCQGTVFQPIMRHKKSVNHLTNPEDITHNTTKYCLKTQQLDSEGEVETILVKGDVMPTSGGGAQVVFTDAESLKQVSPIRVLSPNRKRPSSTMTSTTAILSPTKSNRTRTTNDQGNSLTMTQTLGIEHFAANKRSRQHH